MSFTVSFALISIIAGVVSARSYASPSQQHGCQGDYDCDPDMTCYGSRCVREQVGYGGPSNQERCRYDSDCVDNMVCNNGFCQARGHYDGPNQHNNCRNNLDCLENMVCQRGTCIDRCLSNRDCPSNMVCSRHTGTCIRRAVIPKPGPVVMHRSGVCPALRGAGICRHECTYDRDCSGILKCCSAGCGRICVRPILTKY